MYACGKKRYTILKRDNKFMIIELTVYVHISVVSALYKSRLRNKILILNTYLYLLLEIVHNILIPGYKDITLHIFFLVLFW